MLDAIRRFFKKLEKDFKQNQAKGSQKAMIEELFNDWYVHRREVYKMNFVRGIFFGFGSVLGGTIVVALLVFLISLFTELPVVGDFFQETKNTLDGSSEQ